MVLSVYYFSAHCKKLHFVLSVYLGQLSPIGYSSKKYAWPIVDRIKSVYSEHYQN